MKCTICKQEVTKSQLKYGDAIKSVDGYTHTDCIDDLSRPDGDAHKREI